MRRLVPATFLGLTLLAAPVRAATVDSFRMANAACPVDVTEECRGRCTVGGDASARCRWPDFGCDFKICWGTRHHTVWEDLMTLLVTPRSYALEGATPMAGGVNYISLIRLIQVDFPGLFLTRGQFVLELPALSSPARSRRLIQWAQRCALLAISGQADQLESSARSDTVYRVSSCVDRAYFVRAAFTAERGPAVSVPPPAARSTAPPPGSSDGGETAREVERVRRLPPAELRRFLQHTTSGRRIEVRGRRITVDGIAPFTASEDPERQQQVMEDLTDPERVGLKELYRQLSDEAIAEATAHDPPGPGEAYVYNPDTGEAELRATGDGYIKGGPGASTQRQPEGI